MNLENPYIKPYQFKCTKCGKCCKDKSTIINLTYIDIDRIQQGLKLSFKQLMDVIGFYVFETKLTQDDKKKMVLPPIETENGPAFVGLRKDEEGKCIFLDKNDRCTIYKYRPNICRTFPFHFNAEAKTQPQDHLKIKMNVAEKAVDYCPGFDKKYEGVDPKDWLEIGKHTVKNIVEEAAIIQNWNQSVEESEITPKAENYVRSVLRFAQSHLRGDPKRKNSKDSKTSKKKSYSQIAKEKLRKKNQN